MNYNDRSIILEKKEFFRIGSHDSNCILPHIRDVLNVKNTVGDVNDLLGVFQ